METIRIGLIGDHKPAIKAHAAIPKALDLAAKAADFRVEQTWLATDHIHCLSEDTLSRFSGFWCTPASPYADMDGALRAIRFAREHNAPFLGTCAGFQHTLIEFARNVLGLTDADHAETNPTTATPLIAPMSCALIEARGTIRFTEGTRLRAMYGRAEAEEEFHCSYGLNPRFCERLNASNLLICGEAPNGEVRAVELRGHPFYFATLFQPERSALRGVCHPLVLSFVRAAAQPGENAE